MIVVQGSDETAVDLWCSCHEAADRSWSQVPAYWSMGHGMVKEGVSGIW